MEDLRGVFWTFAKKQHLKKQLFSKKNKEIFMFYYLIKQKLNKINFYSILKKNTWWRINFGRFFLNFSWIFIYIVSMQVINTNTLTITILVWFSFGCNSFIRLFYFLNYFFKPQVEDLIIKNSKIKLVVIQHTKWTRQNIYINKL